MSKFNLTGANINATNLHIGDTYYYSSSQEFITKNADLRLTETEIELVHIIFDNTESEEERKLILRSLTSIKNGEGTEEEKKASILSFKPLLKKLNDIGAKVAVDVTAKVLTDFATQHNFTDIVHSILK